MSMPASRCLATTSRDGRVDPGLELRLVDVLALDLRPDHVGNLGGSRQAARVGREDPIGCAGHFYSGRQRLLRGRGHARATAREPFYQSGSTGKPRSGNGTVRLRDHLTRRKTVAEGAVVIVGGTQGLGRRLAERFTQRGRDVVITGRDPARTAAAAQEIGGATRGTAMDLGEPDEIDGCFDGVGAGRSRRARGNRARLEQRPRLRHRARDQAGHAEARRIHRGAALPAPADARRQLGAAVRRPGEGAPLSGLDHGHERQRRRHDDGPDIRDRARPGAGQRASIPGSSATVRRG